MFGEESDPSHGGEPQGVTHPDSASKHPPERANISEGAADLRSSRVVVSLAQDVGCMWRVSAHGGPEVSIETLQS